MYAPQIEPYHYFPGSIRTVDPNAASLLEAGRDEGAADGVLAAVTALLRTIHDRFFEDGAGAGADNDSDSSGSGFGTGSGGSGADGAGGSGSGSGSGKVVLGGGAGGSGGDKDSAGGSSRRDAGRSSAGPRSASGNDGNSVTGLPLAQRDVRQVLRDARRGILAGCTLAFSRCAAICASVARLCSALLFRASVVPLYWAVWFALCCALIRQHTSAQKTNSKIYSSRHCRCLPIFELDPTSRNSWQNRCKPHRINLPTKNQSNCIYNLYITTSRAGAGQSPSRIPPVKSSGSWQSPWARAAAQPLTPPPPRTSSRNRAQPIRRARQRPWARMWSARCGCARASCGRGARLKASSRRRRTAQRTGSRRRCNDRCGSARSEHLASLCATWLIRCGCASCGAAASADGRYIEVCAQQCPQGL